MFVLRVPAWLRTFVFLVRHAPFACRHLSSTLPDQVPVPPSETVASSPSSSDLQPVFVRPLRRRRRLLRRPCQAVISTCSSPRRCLSFPPSSTPIASTVLGGHLDAFASCRRRRRISCRRSLYTVCLTCLVLVRVVGAADRSSRLVDVCKYSIHLTVVSPDGLLTADRTASFVSRPLFARFGHDL
jgi:hypothetical protein